MSKWREKSIELFPDLRKEIESDSIYNLFLELLPRVRQAHETKNEFELEKIYRFAKWCFEQTSKELWNSAGVSFYEHLVDDKLTREQITKWVTPEMFDELAPLFQSRMDQPSYEKLFNHYKFQKRNHLTSRST